VTTSTQTRGLTGTWTIDPTHSLVEFSGKHMMFTTVKGRFRDLAGTITLDEADQARSGVEVEIQAASIDSGVEQRDGHLRSADFLDVEQYPTITFISTSLQGSRDEFTLTGDLTLHGVTRQVSLDVTLNGVGTNPYGKTVAGFSAETKISRKEWGLNWNVGLEAGGVLVSDQLKVSVEIQAVRQDA